MWNNHAAKTGLIAMALAAVLLPPAGAGSALYAAPKENGYAAEWQKRLAQELPLFGHRNWIVIVDSAYPAQCRAGIETVATGADQLTVVKTVLAALAKAPHVRPNVYVDAELRAVAEKDAPGISAYREALARIFAQRTVQAVPHEKLIDQLDEAAKTFRVLILKTTMAKPYTSVFLQLDCGYWTADAEQRLRAALPEDTK